MIQKAGFLFHHVSVQREEKFSLKKVYNKDIFGYNYLRNVISKGRSKTMTMMVWTESMNTFHYLAIRPSADRK
ncbi:hypothetical protein M493_13160 [Geobacillus genomosp. 3]|uniref:Uncharacterized protein n=1 Tax=Geobacillus genomosp. 3 TaxID=1921421 RepID=S5ZEW2_GEOG3|nr:hypothetical protein M493_13160 [Geobacillus genomosp. 3]